MMRTLKQTLAGIFLAALCLTGCLPSAPSDAVQTVPIVQPTNPNTEAIPVSRICTLSDGKTYIEVDGKPFTMIGAQIRVDGLYNRDPYRQDAPPMVTDSQLEAYFARAAELGINTVQLALEWSKIEIAKDVYDYSLVDKLLTLVNRYGLRCEFLWFSTNMCGDGHGFCVPEYIMEDPYTYPVYTAKSAYSGMYGEIFYPILNNPALMERERLVLTALMAHIHRWNRENGSRNPLIGMQIHNEADGLLRWRLRQKELTRNEDAVTPQELWQATLEALDNAGKAVKASNYQIYTRCNMTVTLGVGAFPEWLDCDFSPMDVLRLEGIDIIGDDPYNTSPSVINRTIRNYAVAGNFPHIAENMGDYASSPSLLLAAYQAGGAYMFYDLATPPYFIYLNGNGDYHMDQGLLNPDLTDKPHTAATQAIIRGIGAMGELLPLVPSEDFAAFNILTEIPKERWEQTICTSSLSLTYRTEQGGIAFAIEYDGFVYLWATEDCKFEINNASFVLKADIGRFDGTEFAVSESPYIGPTISLPKGVLMRVRIREVYGPVSSTTAENV